MRANRLGKRMKCTHHKKTHTLIFFSTTKNKQTNKNEQTNKNANRDMLRLHNKARKNKMLFYVSGRNGSMMWKWAKMAKDERKIKRNSIPTNENQENRNMLSIRSIKTDATMELWWIASRCSSEASSSIIFLQCKNNNRKNRIEYATCYFQEIKRNRFVRFLINRVDLCST